MFTVTVGKAKVGVAVMVGVNVMVGVRVMLEVSVIVEVNVASGVEVKRGVCVSVGGNGVGVITCKGRLQAKTARVDINVARYLFFI